MGDTRPTDHPGGPVSWPTDCVVVCEDPPVAASAALAGATPSAGQQQQPQRQQPAAAGGAQCAPALMPHPITGGLSRTSSDGSSVPGSSLDRSNSMEAAGGPSADAAPAWSGLPLTTVAHPEQQASQQQADVWQDAAPAAGLRKTSSSSSVAPLEVRALGDLPGSSTSRGSTPTSSAAASQHQHPIISPSSSNGDLSCTGGSMDSASASPTSRAHVALSTAPDVAAANHLSKPLAAAGGGSSSSSSKPRTYYIDWLRVFLTLIVVVHHCVSTYTSSWTAWAAKPGDTTLWLLSEFFVVGNQAYFMTLFFFLSGLYVPGSFRRKGPWRFLFDRTLRLVLPCLVYSLIVPPLMVYLVDTAKNPTSYRPLSSAFRDWFAPVWPTRYLLPTGPPWFLWMLWWFNVAYVILAVLCQQAMRISAVAALHAKVAAAWQKRGQKKAAGVDAVAVKAQLAERDSQADLEACGIPAVSPRAAAATPKAVVYVAPREYTLRQCLVGGGLLIAVLFTVMFGARVVLWRAAGLRPATFFTYGPFISLMPDYLFVYVVGFTLGTFSGPSAWNVLPRLPAIWAGWLLCFGGVWWTLAGFLLNVTLRNFINPTLHPASTFLAAWALRTFTEQSFAVVWSVGLLILFREAFNVRPARLGQRIITGAYGAYLVHMPIVMCLARALMTLPLPSAVLNATAIMLPAVVSAWLVACAIRAIPGADRVL